ncbi:class I SAM-dependent methyltransferase [candidate division KSB1 bacterium]|nr:class I SAM-dependent methyltransferase [candidate division KSB1 bacterium]
MNSTNEKTYVGSIERLRRPERVALIQPETAVAACVKELDIQSVLDVGTGTGLLAEHFVKLGIDVTGVDRNPEYLKEARKLIPAANFQLGNMDQLEFDPDSFDLVFMGQVFHETNHHEKVLADCNRIARKLVCILEWPYQIEENGPPLEHRLQTDDILKWAEQIGFSKIRSINQTHMILYSLEV